MLSERPDSRRIRVLVVDDHEMFADSLRRVLDSGSDVEVVGVVGTIGDAIVSAAQLLPDVVLMDYQLPDGDGVTAVARIKREEPSTQVLMLTGSGEDEQLARRAFEAGCAGFLGKSRPVADLLTAVRAAHGGTISITPTMLLRLLPTEKRQRQADATILTDRELEVLSVMTEGASNREIASSLYVSVNTVRKHTQNIIRKLGAHSKHEAVIIASRKGVIPPIR
jgi:DNA-binding NarL/FixJ family response regulator